MDLIELKKKTEASKSKVPVRPPQNLPEKVERRGKVSLAKKKLTTLKKNQMRQKQTQEESKREAADLFSVLNEASQNSKTIIKLSKIEDSVSELKSISTLHSDCNENCLSGKVENIDGSIENKDSQNDDVTDELINDLKNLMNPIHSRKFREYCNHILSPEIDKNLKELIEMVVSFHQRLYSQDPVKAKMRRRYYCGLREALKHMNSVKCLVISPNLKPSPGKGCLDELIYKVVNSASERGVTTIFGLSDRILGRLCHRKVPVSCISLINIQGAQEKFERLKELLPEAKEHYENLLKRQ
ncbi:Selenocysteine insertion sequence-binding protein 2-like [Armadillidium nasatum]|uniref:Selenocysteine insertion sequence-binding protein 2-like n=1 Tax=Armadillidium nasatum TaxID=96803 RepID=A0A5N5SMM0_9CRUS|nr:Selenocysteine insertion sequence-binding protein 2-like [Armadillidium nasatum]